MDLMAVESSLDDARDRRGRHRDSHALECSGRGPARGCLRHAGHFDGSAEHVREDLQPGVVREQRVPRRDHGLDPADRVEHVGQAVRDPLERGLRDLAGRRLEREAGDETAAVHVPAERALAAEKRQERQPVRGLVGRLGVAQRLLQPRVQVPAVGERTAFAEPPLVEAVRKSPGRGSAEGAS